MKVRLGDLNLRVSPEVTTEAPEWLTDRLEFDCPTAVRAGNVVLNKDYGGHRVVLIWLWRSEAPLATERRVAEVYFRNNGTEVSPEILSAVKLV